MYSSVKTVIENKIEFSHNHYQQYKMKTTKALSKKNQNGLPDENKEGIDNHKDAAHHHEKAAKHHQKAAKHHKAGDHAKANKSTGKAQAHHNLANTAQQKDVKFHASYRRGANKKQMV